MIAVLIFFFLHWYLSAFAQSFFLHRYAAHRMFKLSFFWERFFYFFTFITQGSSFLHPRSYALLHLEHHSHSDTDKDPHSPYFFKDVFSMMWNTKNVYQEIREGKRSISDSFKKKCPEWPVLDRIADYYSVRLGFIALYAYIYFLIDAPLWCYPLLIVHALMGPFHGAFINWCGHKYGYRNFKLKDHSKNTFAWDLFFMGECFQNNHHQFPQRPNFAIKWFEFDVVYPVIVLFERLKILKLAK